MPRSGTLWLFLLAGIAGCGKGEIAPEVLAEKAISSAAPVAEQEQAVLELGRRGPTVVPLLRLVMNESKTPIVRAAAIQSLGAYQDFPSGPNLFAAMEDPDPLIRGRAAAAITAIIGADYHYRPEAKLAERTAIMRGMKRSYDQMSLNPDLQR